MSFGEYPIETGTVLISAPGPHFENTISLDDYPSFIVVITSVCSTYVEGYHLNIPTSEPVPVVFEPLREMHAPVYSGGKTNSALLNIIHSLPGTLECVATLGENLFLGNFFQDHELIRTLSNADCISPDKIRFLEGNIFWKMSEFQRLIEEKQYFIIPEKLNGGILGMTPKEQTQLWFMWCDKYLYAPNKMIANMAIYCRSPHN